MSNVNMMHWPCCKDQFCNLDDMVCGIVCIRRAILADCSCIGNCCVG